MHSLIASIYFGKQRTLLAITERQEDAFVLHYLNMTSSYINLNNISDKNSVKNLAELSLMMAAFSDKISKLFVVIDRQDAFITKFPCNMNENIFNIRELVELEVRQNFQNAGLSNFNVKVFDIFSNSNNQMLLATFIPQNIIDTCRQIIKGFGTDITDFNVSSIAAINSYIFNYPDEKNENNLIISLDSNVMQFSMLANNKIFSYDIAIDATSQNIPEIIENKANRIISLANIENFKNIFTIGSDLTKSNFFKCWEIGALLGSDTKRLNSFRMFKTTLGKRERDYCSRIFHLFAPCIGGLLPLSCDYKMI